VLTIPVGPGAGVTKTRIIEPARKAPAAPINIHPITLSKNLIAQSISTRAQEASPLANQS
jgi:hypothetical protein